MTSTRRCCPHCLRASWRFQRFDGDNLCPHCGKDINTPPEPSATEQAIIDELVANWLPVNKEQEWDISRRVGILLRVGTRKVMALIPAAREAAKEKKP